MPTLRFRIGDKFAPTDPVARFVVRVAMMSNDSLRLLSRLPLSNGYYFDAPELRITSLRVQAALAAQVVQVVEEARQSDPRVDEFLEILPATARRDLEKVLAAPSGTDSYDLGVTQTAGPERGRYGVETALAAAADVEGTITAKGPDEIVRFDFADEIARRLTPEGDIAAASALHEGAFALARFARAATFAYLFPERGPGE